MQAYDPVSRLPKTGLRGEGRREPLSIDSLLSCIYGLYGPVLFGISRATPILTVPKISCDEDRASQEQIHYIRR